MNKTGKLFTVTLIVAITTGCTSYFKRSASIVANKNGDHIGTIFVWEPDSNAALLNKRGKLCMQNALAINTTDTSISAKLSDAILELTESSKKIPENDKESKENIANITTTIKQTATMLTTSTERTAFLNTGLFYICQLAANSEISDNDMIALTQTLITSSAGLNSILDK